MKLVDGYDEIGVEIDIEDSVFVKLRPKKSFGKLSLAKHTKTKVLKQLPKVKQFRIAGITTFEDLYAVLKIVSQEYWASGYRDVNIEITKDMTTKVVADGRELKQPRWVGVFGGKLFIDTTEELNLPYRTNQFGTTIFYPGVTVGRFDRFSLDDLTVVSMDKTAFVYRGADKRLNPVIAGVIDSIVKSYANENLIAVIVLTKTKRVKLYLDDGFVAGKIPLLQKSKFEGIIERVWELTDSLFGNLCESITNTVIEDAGIPV